MTVQQSRLLFGLIMSMGMRTELLILLENAMMSIINERIKRICVNQHFCNLGCGYYNYYIFYRCKILFKLNNYFSMLESCKLSFLLFSFPLLFCSFPIKSSKIHQILKFEFNPESRCMTIIYNNQGRVFPRIMFADSQNIKSQSHN